ncbi:hypothetical protein F1880_004035 [Penicillium rolfsii]|nr:hypothetical protein F1880_004035 [Penicillium rolfsii]
MGLGVDLRSHIFVFGLHSLAPERARDDFALLEIEGVIVNTGHGANKRLVDRESGRLLKALGVFIAISGEVGDLENPGASIGFVVDKLGIGHLAQTVDVLVEERATGNGQRVLAVAATRPGVLDAQGRGNVETLAHGRLHTFVGVNNGEVNGTVESNFTAVLTADGEINNLLKLVTGHLRKLGVGGLGVAARDERYALDGGALIGGLGVFGDNGKVPADGFHLGTLSINTIKGATLACGAQETELLSGGLRAGRFQTNHLTTGRSGVKADLLLELGAVNGKTLETTTGTAGADRERSPLFLLDAGGKWRGKRAWRGDDWAWETREDGLTAVGISIKERGLEAAGDRLLRLLLRRLRATEDAASGRLLLLALVTTKERGPAGLISVSLGIEQATSGGRRRPERLCLLSLPATEQAASSLLSLRIAEAATKRAASIGSRTTAEQRSSGLLRVLSATKKTRSSRRLLSLTTAEQRALGLSLLSLATAEERRAGVRLASTSSSLLLLVGSSETTTAAEQSSSRLLGLGLVITESKGGSSGLLLLTSTKRRCGGSGAAERVGSGGGLSCTKSSSKSSASRSGAESRLILLLGSAKERGASIGAKSIVFVVALPPPKRDPVWGVWVAPPNIEVAGLAPPKRGFAAVLLVPKALVVCVVPKPVGAEVAAAPPNGVVLAPKPVLACWPPKPVEEPKAGAPKPPGCPLALPKRRPLVGRGRIGVLLGKWVERSATRAFASLRTLESSTCSTEASVGRTCSKSSGTRGAKAGAARVRGTEPSPSFVAEQASIGVGAATKSSGASGCRSKTTTSAESRGCASVWCGAAEDALASIGVGPETRSAVLSSGTEKRCALILSVGTESC